jgi:tetratricopeptide (TPR) repeat protein
MLGALLSKGDYDGALVQYEKALAVRDSVLGKAHLDTAAISDNIALVLNEMGDYEGALVLFQKAL